MHSRRARVRSDFLVAQPSLWTGLARLLDLFGVFDGYNISRSPGEADARALVSDWWVAGDDLRDAYEAIREGDGRQGRLFDEATHA